MKSIILYHGSTEIIEHPQYGMGKIYNDYGQGFYCTESIELAKEWACTEQSDGYANRYELKMQGLEVLDLTSGEYSVLNWLAILMENRIVSRTTPIEKRGRDYLLQEFLPDYKGYDIIRGYRADDSYFSFARAFVGNTISLQQLGYAMRLGKLGEQYTVKSQKAFEQTTFLSYELAKRSEHYARKRIRDEKAREDYIALLEKEEEQGIYMRDIIREKMRKDDERLQ